MHSTKCQKKIIICYHQKQFKSETMYKRGNNLVKRTNKDELLIMNYYSISTCNTTKISVKYINMIKRKLKVNFKEDSISIKCKESTKFVILLFIIIFINYLILNIASCIDVEYYENRLPQINLSRISTILANNNKTGARKDVTKSRSNKLWIRESQNKEESKKIDDEARILDYRNSFLNDFMNNIENFDRFLSYGIDEVIKVVYYPTDNDSDGCLFNNKDVVTNNKDLTNKDKQVFTTNLDRSLRRKRDLNESNINNRSSNQFEIYGLNDDFNTTKNDQSMSQSQIEPRSKRVHRSENIDQSISKTNQHKNHNSNPIRLIKSVINPPINETHMKMLQPAEDNYDNNNNLYDDLGETNIDNKPIFSINRTRRPRKNIHMTTQHPQQSDIPSPISDPYSLPTSPLSSTTSVDSNNMNELTTMAPLDVSSSLDQYGSKQSDDTNIMENLDHVDDEYSRPVSSSAYGNKFRNNDLTSDNHVDYNGNNTYPLDIDEHNEDNQLNNQFEFVKQANRQKKDISKRINRNIHKKSANLIASNNQIPPPQQNPSRRDLSETINNDNNDANDYNNSQNSSMQIHDGQVIVPQVGDAQVLNDQQSSSINHFRGQQTSKEHASINTLDESQLKDLLKHMNYNDNHPPGQLTTTTTTRTNNQQPQTHRRPQISRFVSGSIYNQQQPLIVKNTLNRSNIYSNPPYLAINPNTINHNWNRYTNNNENNNDINNNYDANTDTTQNQQPIIRQILTPEPNSHIENSFYNSNTNVINNAMKQHNKRASYEKYPAMPTSVVQSQTSLTSAPISKLRASASIPNLAYTTGNIPYYYKKSPITNPLDDPQYTNTIAAIGSPGQNQIIGFIKAAGPISPSLSQHGSQVPIRKRSPPYQLSANNNQQPILGEMKLPTVNTPAIVFSQQQQQPYNLLSSIQPYLSTQSTRYTKPIYNYTPQKSLQHRISRIGQLANSSGGSQYAEEPNAQSSITSAATSEPMWSDTQNQEDEYQQAPQTIQITAVPNGGFVGNGLVGNGWNGWNGWNGVGGPWNGRQVLLVNRQPQVGSEWRQWILPVAAVLSLPLILGALFVPVFLKSVMFLIQILQMLGLLMPPASLANHLASSSHSSTSVG